MVDPHWNSIVGRIVSVAIPLTYMVLDKYSYVRDLAVELRRVKEDVIKNLDHYIEATRKSVERVGGHFYLASDPKEARDIVGKIVGSGKVVVMSKNNVATEVGLRPYLETQGNEVWETDLGEFLVQVTNEEPSHILAPALHIDAKRAAEAIKERLGIDVPPEAGAIASAVGEFLREKFMRAHIGITGANAIAADTGAVVLVENEGNIRMTTVVPRIHVVFDGVEKIVPTLYHAMIEAMVQAAYAGLYPPTYVNVSSGPSSTADIELVRVSPAQGPREFHVILVDNGRRIAAKDPVLWEALLCIRCGRCFLHCPTYRALGKAWGIPPYTGPMGIMWTSVVRGIRDAGPHALLCMHAGNCREVCPMGINITGVIQELKARYSRVNPSRSPS